MTKNSYPIRNRLITAGAVLSTATVALSACDVDKTGYTAEQKQQLSGLVKPDAVKIAKLALEHGDGVSLSDDKKTYIASIGLDNEKPHYSALVEYKNTGRKPGPSDVISINLDHWITDQSNPKNLTIDESINIDAQGDHINTDSYWSVTDLNTLGDTDKSNDIFISDLPVVNGTGNKNDMKGVADTARIIMESVDTEFIPGLLHQQN